jgi:DNA adenine methylase
MTLEADTGNIQYPQATQSSYFIMRYFGGKQRISKPLAKYINSQLKPNQTFIDLFCGSCNVISKIDNKRTRIANDIHPELIAMWEAVQSGAELPNNILEEQYYYIKKYGESWLRGFVGFGCSFAGKWWGGYARGGEDRNYCMNAKNSTLKKISTMQDVVFTNHGYKEFGIFENSYLRKSFIYCDIPYKDSTGYSMGDFNHDSFYQWAYKVKQKYEASIYVSEYLQNVPDFGNVIWKYQSKKDIRNRDGIQEPTTEILFTIQ